MAGRVAECRVFLAVQEHGGISDNEMFQTLNMGVGMIAVVAASDADSVIQRLRASDEEALSAVFERFEGFKEVRLVSVRAVAFAEFENEQFAITAKEATANTPIGAEGKPMKVTYQRQ